jgi:hypothetical protein
VPRRKKKTASSGNLQPSGPPSKFPTTPASSPEPARAPSEFEKLKLIFLNNRYIAFFLLAITVFGLGIKQLSDSFDFFKRFRSPVVSVKASSRQFDSSPSTFLTIPLTITLVSSDKDQINDVKIRVTAEKQRDDGTVSAVPDEDLPSYFIVDPESIDVGPIDTKTGATPHDLRMMVDASGEFRLRISAVSGGHEVGYCQVALSAISKDVQDAITNADKKSPLILVKRDGVIEPWPVDYRELSDFSLLLLREFEKKGNAARATLRLQDYYIGACPKNCFMGLGDLGAERKSEPTTNPPSPHFTELGLMGIGPITRFPIGTRVYELDRLSDFRLTIKDATASACVRVEGSTDKPPSYHGEDRTWYFKSLNITATENTDCGATGRICATTVSFNGRSFEDVDSMDELEPTHSDFPAFFDLNEDSVKRINLTDGAVTIEQCALR